MTPKDRDPDPIELDGRTFEGGGQLLRIALCLSALTRKPIKITNIRGNRSGGGGLKAQHLACVKWLAHASNALVEGAEKGSKTLLFRPRVFDGDLSPAFTKVHASDGTQQYECHLDIGTAGSTGLALQAILPYILFTARPAPLRTVLRLSGGTNVSGSPSFDYVEQVLLPTLARIGLPEMKGSCAKRGWSQGGSSIGTWTLEIPPRASLALPEFHYHHPASTSRKRAPAPSHIEATLLAPTSVHAHLQTVLPPALTHHFPSISTTTTLRTRALDSGHPKRLYLLLTASASAAAAATSPERKEGEESGATYTLGRDWLHERKTPSAERAVTEMAERVSKQLADEWASGAWVDEHMRDQLVIFQALASGRSEVWVGRDEEEEGGELQEPSLHARTAEWVCRQMLGVRFDSEGVCEGVGFGDAGGGDVGGCVDELERLRVG